MLGAILYLFYLVFKFISARSFYNWSMNDLKIKINREAAKLSLASISNLVEDLICYAYKSGASDIHLDPLEENFNVRVRIDGQLLNLFYFSKSIHAAVISRIKILAGLRTDEHQAPQDGRFRLKLNTEDFLDLRVSVVPTYYGENCVLRLLVTKNSVQSLEHLHFSRSDIAKILRSLKKLGGMLLVTGPTGSGKTTTLYTLLKLLNQPGISLVTIEDPVEYAIVGIKQIQVNHASGLTFSSGLRSILRQDPDIIMVGEIRDSETAKISVNVALTGHLLLSTLHTNDAATTLPRLLDMGIESYLVASTVNLVIGQRLVRKICEQCKREQDVWPESLKEFQQHLPADSGKIKFFEGAGCESCEGTGFKGRLALCEVLEMSEVIRTAILNKHPASEIKKIAQLEGMRTLVQDGFEKAVSGLTTLGEILKVLNE